MFTGIVTAIGTVRSVESRGDSRRIAIATPFAADGLAIGASVACAGVCLTVVERRPDGEGALLLADLGPETLAVTTAAGWAAGTRLNLERPLRIGDELGGHLVTGHVDGVAQVTEREDLGTTSRFAFGAPARLARFIAAKGSVTLDGTSLTVNEVEEARFTCLLVPHTLAVTTWGERRPGDPVNLEVDLMARYAARLTGRD